MNVPLTPIRCLYRGVDLYPKKIGVVSGGCRYTYAQFGERCERLAAGLLSAGTQPGDRIAYLSFNNNQLLEGYFGVPLAGAMVMPLNVRLTPFELTAILNHAEPRILIFETDFAPVVEQLRQACPKVEQWIEIGQEYEDLLAHGRIARPDPFSIDENAIAELFYTSGSTGTPKGVMLSHRTVYLHALGCAASMLPGDDHVELHTIPLFHANGWGRAQISTMNGLRQVMVRRFDPPQVLRLIQEEKATAHGAGADHGQRPAELSRSGRLRLVEHAAHHDGRRGLLARAGGPHGTDVSLPCGSRLRTDGKRARRDLRPAQKHGRSMPMKTTGCSTAPWPVGRWLDARCGWWTCG